MLFRSFSFCFSFLPCHDVLYGFGLHLCPPNAVFLFCLLIVVLFFIFFLARFIAVVPIVSVCLVCDFSIVATCPSMPAGRFAFVCVLFVLFFVVRSCFVR